MLPWRERSLEERNLLNPAFCATLLWNAAQGYTSERNSTMALELSFLVLPVVLHLETRESLPRSVRTSLTTWLAEHPLFRTRLAERAANLRSFTREGLLFGGTHGLLALRHDGVRARTEMRLQVLGTLSESSEEVRACAKRADFLGRWLERAGNAETVMALLGVRP